jgi:polysaccharide biosynthesis transport protein
VSDAGSPPAPAPTPSQTQTQPPFRPWWLPGLVVGALVAAGALLVAQVRPSTEGTHRAEAIVQFPDTDPEARRRRMFLLRAPDLVTRSLAEPAAAALPSVKRAADPVADVTARLAVAELSPGVVSVTLTGDDPDEVKVILDLLVKRFVDDATGFDRRYADDRRKQLEQLAESMRTEIEATDKNIEMLARANSTTGDTDTARRLAILQQRFAEADAEYTRVGRELVKLEAEVTVLKRQAEAKNAEPNLDRQARLAQLATTIDINKEVRDKFRVERDVLQRSIGAGSDGRFDVQRMREALKPQQEALNRIYAELAQLRISQNLGGRVELRGEVAVAPTRSRFDRVASAGAVAGIAFASGFVLATAFSFVGLVFRVLRRAA